MWNLKNLLIAGTFAVLGSHALAENAAADYYVSVWRNDTNATVGGSYQWGNGPWKPFRIAPGRNFGTWFNVRGGNPPLKIQFDNDPGPGRDATRYRLRTYTSPTTVLNKGPTERFITRPNGTIDLVRTRP